ncbi:hypothetical protein [Mycobacterium sp. IDR2000157661]|uniref:hypothetical protein n=1 Tax=Mycobacterium sp. IDR2000157661 TaxID=2867005 RepID=UPI001EE9D072|nr:hypothetical protein [Mycobacterium sp. IDR2000157661]ULE32266.1 hypothetical protein K3G64_19315 [Mycobacterium sp. IDR2000157661]
MAERGALWGWDLEEIPVEPTDDARYDAGYEVHHDGAEAIHVRDTAHDPITEPIPLTSDDIGAAPADDLADFTAFADPPRAAVEADSWDEPRPTSYAHPFIERPAGIAIVGTLTFKPARNPWYRTKAALTALLLLAAAALLLAIVPMVLRSDSAGPDGSTDGAPAPSSSAAPSSAPPSPPGVQPTLTSVPAVAPPPPPPPPAPPPPASVQDSAPGYTPYYPPRNSSPSQSNKPEIDVTRAPISVAPDRRGPIENPATRNRNGNNSGW